MKGLFSFADSFHPSAGGVCVQLAQVYKTRYRITLRQFPTMPSSLYMNLHGEEGEGAQRNRRFCVVDLFVLTSKSPSFCLHPRIDEVDLSSKLKALLPKEPKEEASSKKGADPPSSVEEVERLFEGLRVSSTSPPSTTTQTREPEKGHVAESAAAKAKGQAVQKEISLRTLLPTRCRVLEESDLLAEYLVRHVQGLIERCSLRLRKEKALLKSSLWWALALKGERPCRKSSLPD